MSQKITLGAAAALLPWPAIAWAQDSVTQAQLAAAETPAQTAPEPDEAKLPPSDRERKSGHDLLIVPIPQSSPTLGSGLTLVGALFYNPNREPQPWITGVGVMATSNGSRAFGAYHKMSLGGDRIRLGLFGGYAKVNVEYFGVGPNAGTSGRSVELAESGYAAAAQAQYRVARHVYVGGRVSLLNLNSSVRKENPIFPEDEIPRRDFNTQMVSVAPIITFDSRDNPLYPTNGEVVTAAVSFSVPALGSDYSHEKFTLAANLYRTIAKGSVLAGRVAVCGVSTGAPFYDLCLYGSTSDLRGYAAGRYQDRATWTVQVELRKHLFGRFSGVLFGGIGGVAPSLSDLPDSMILPSVGAGLRYRPLKNNPIHMRVDFAVGKNSHALYIGVGEAF